VSKFMSAAAAQLAAKAAAFTFTSSNSSSNGSGGTSARPVGTRLLTAEQLQQYQGAGGSSMYLAILGDIFDVSSKPEFYGEHASAAHLGSCSPFSTWAIPAAAPASTLQQAVR
jgi:hypothetical protein